MGGLHKQKGLHWVSNSNGSCCGFRFERTRCARWLGIRLDGLDGRWRWFVSLMKLVPFIHIGPFIWLQSHISGNQQAVKLTVHYFGEIIFCLNRLLHIV